MNVLKIIPETITDGEGIRMSIYVSGCKHYCKGCHNHHTWNFDQGYLFDDNVLESIIQNYKKNPLLNGITFSGGDPLETENAKDLLYFLKKLKEENINIWCYTGYVYEELLKLEPQKECLKYIDVLVDGPFIEDLKNPNLLFRGSSNQRIIKLRSNEIS